MHVQSCCFAYFDVLVAVAKVPFTPMLFQGSEKDDSEMDPESDYAPSEDDDEDESSQSEYSSETETSESGSGKDTARPSSDIFIYCCFSNNVYNPRHKENDNHTYIYVKIIFIVCWNKQSRIKREARPRPFPLMRPAGGKGWVKTKASYQVLGEVAVMQPITKLANMIRGKVSG